MKFLPDFRFIMMASILLLANVPVSAQMIYTDAIGKWSFESLKIENASDSDPESRYNEQYTFYKVRLEIKQDGTIIETYMDVNGLTGEQVEKSIFLKLEQTPGGDLLGSYGVIFGRKVLSWDLQDGRLIIHSQTEGVPPLPMDLIFKKQ